MIGWSAASSASDKVGSGTAIGIGAGRMAHVAEREKPQGRGLDGDPGWPEHIAPRHCTGRAGVCFGSESFARGEWAPVSRSSS